MADAICTKPGCNNIIHQAKISEDTCPLHPDWPLAKATAMQKKMFGSKTNNRTEYRGKMLRKKGATWATPARV